jgi:hypothetical protein
MPVILNPFLVLGAVLVASTAAAAPASPPPSARARAAIPEFQVEGETSPALVLQLQDGFLVGLTRAGVQVLDSVDVSHRLQGHPELEKCDTSLCLKQLAEVLDVRYLLRVRVNVTRNSYRMTARLFHTGGASPAVLPEMTQSRFCEVCTVAEAREVMIRLADAVRRPLDEPITASGQPSGEPDQHSLLPGMALGVGLVALVGGAALYLSAEHSAKATPALGGALMGAGLTVTGLGVYLMMQNARAPASPALGLAGRF